MLDQTEKVIDKLVFHFGRSQPESVFIFRVLAETRRLVMGTHFQTKRVIAIDVLETPGGGKDKDIRS